MAEKISVFDKTTGHKYMVPERWLTLDHPQFKRFSKTPLQRRAERDQNPAPEPVINNPASEPDAPDTEESEA